MPRLLIHNRFRNVLLKEILEFSEVKIVVWSNVRVKSRMFRNITLKKKVSLFSL